MTFSQTTHTDISNQPPLAIEYRDVAGYPGYRVGNDGSLWSCRKRGRGAKGVTNQWSLLRGHIDHDGRRRIMLRPGKQYVPVSQLILVAFVGPCPPGMEVCHGDGDASNDALTNLRWGTRQSNMDDRTRHGRTGMGESHALSKLTDDDVIGIRRAYSSGGVTMIELAKRHAISPAQISSIVHGNSWKHLLSVGELQAIDEQKRSRKLSEDRLAELSAEWLAIPAIDRAG